MRIPKSWRTPRSVMGLFIFEFLVTVPALALYGIAAPNTFRTALWEDGAKNGFNSDPKMAQYAVANYRPMKTPMVWSQFLTNWNLVISVLAMFILLVKTVLHVVHVFYPLLSLLVHLILAAFWAVSVYGQAGPDRSDPAHPSSAPWYLTKNCSVANNKNNVHYCSMAKGSFAVAVIMLAISVAHIPLAIISLVKPKKAQADQMEDDEKSTPDSAYANDKPWKLEDVPRTPAAAKTPFTPRTLAFNTLSAGR